MDKSTSLYLDLCRFFAALIVFFHHYFYQPFYMGDFRLLAGRKAVVIFFVISGFVIAYVTDRKEATAREYCINRATRLYSVVLPAIVLTILLDYTVLFIDPNFFDPNVHSWPGLRVLTSLLFLNQSWNLTTAAFSNGPFWSLCYEFWYYVVFGLFIYAPKNVRYPLMAISMSIAGPRILLLLPVWLFGVAAYYLQASIRDTRFATLIFTASTVISALLMFGEVDSVSNAVRFVNSQLMDGYFIISPSLKVFIGGDAAFPADYALGIAFALTVMTYGSSRLRFQIPEYVVSAIRFCASYTFSLYLFHAPLLLFFAALAGNLPIEPFRGIVLISATLLSAWLLGTVTEQRKNVYKRFFLHLSAQITLPRRVKEGHL